MRSVRIYVYTFTYISYINRENLFWKMIPQLHLDRPSAMASKISLARSKLAAQKNDRFIKSKGASLSLLSKSLVRPPASSINKLPAAKSQICTINQLEKKDIKKESNVMGKEKLKRTKQDLERGRELLKDLGISESDKEHIFDMIEMDLEDYE